MSNLFAKKRSAITRTVAIVLALVLVVAIIAGEEVLNSANKSTGTTTGIDLHIYEDNPVLQIDHFYPDTIYVSPGENVSLAIQNLDDETRVFTIAQFGINVTIISGGTDRVMFTAKQLGNYSFLSPITPPSAASGNLKGPCLEGFFEVTQNSTLVSTTSTGTGVPPSEAQVLAANSGPIGSCTGHPLTAPAPV